MIIFFAIDDDILRIRLSQVLLVACSGCSSFCRHNFNLFWCFWLPLLEINLLIPWHGTGAPAGKVESSAHTSVCCTVCTLPTLAHCALCAQHAYNMAANFGYNHFRIIIVTTSNFQAFACSNLKWLCCSVGIWKDTHFTDRSKFWICCFAQDSIGKMLLWSCALCLLRDLDWLKDRVKLWEWLWSATSHCSSEIHQTH